MSEEGLGINIDPVSRGPFPVILRTIFTLNIYYKIMHCLYFLKRGASCVMVPWLKSNLNKPFGLRCIQEGFTRSNLC